MNIKAVADRVASFDKNKSLLTDLVDRTVEHRCSACNSITEKGDVKGVWETRCRKCGHFTVHASA